MEAVGDEVHMPSFKIFVRSYFRHIYHIQRWQLGLPPFGRMFYLLIRGEVTYIPAFLPAVGYVSPRVPKRRTYPPW